MSRPRKGVIRVDMPVATDEVIQARVAPLLPTYVMSYWNRAVLASVVRAAYVQGAMDALEIATHHPTLVTPERRR